MERQGQTPSESGLLTKNLIEEKFYKRVLLSNNIKRGLIAGYLLFSKKVKDVFY